MAESNELLRSAHAIAARRGEDTNWKAFINNLEKELVAQVGGDINNEQHVLRATCTPKTYRLPIIDGKTIPEDER